MWHFSQDTYKKLSLKLGVFYSNQCESGADEKCNWKKIVFVSQKVQWIEQKTVVLLWREYECREIFVVKYKYSTRRNGEASAQSSRYHAIARFFLNY